MENQRSTATTSTMSMCWRDKRMKKLWLRRSVFDESLVDADADTHIYFRKTRLGTIPKSNCTFGSCPLPSETGAVRFSVSIHISLIPLWFLSKCAYIRLWPPTNRRNNTIKKEFLIVTTQWSQQQRQQHHHHQQQRQWWRIIILMATTWWKDEKK